MILIKKKIPLRKWSGLDVAKYALENWTWKNIEHIENYEFINNKYDSIKGTKVLAIASQMSKIWKTDEIIPEFWINGKDGKLSIRLYFFFCLWKENKYKYKLKKTKI